MAAIPLLRVGFGEEMTDSMLLVLTSALEFKDILSLVTRSIC